MFAVDEERTSGVALALFRDGLRSAGVQDGRLVFAQGEVTGTVTRRATCGGRRSGRA